MTILDDLRKKNQEKLARKGLSVAQSANGTSRVKRVHRISPTHETPQPPAPMKKRPPPPSKKIRATSQSALSAPRSRKRPNAPTPRTGAGSFAEPKAKKAKLTSTKLTSSASKKPAAKKRKRQRQPNDLISNYGGWCPDCKSGDDVIQDQRGGRLVCTGCGLVVNNQLISDDAEWRNFSGSDNTGPDPNRVGAGYSNLKSETANMLTFVGDENSRLARLQKQQFSNSERKTIAAHDTIRKFATRLNLPNDISYCACDLYKQIVDARTKGKGSKPGILSGTGKKAPILCATVLYISAKAGSCPRPLNEVCQELGLEKSQICSCYGEIMKIKADGKLKLHKNVRRSNNSPMQDFSVRYANKLKLPGNIVNACRVIVGQIEKIGFLSGRRPGTVAAAAVYLACLESSSDSDRRNPTEISIVSHAPVSEIKTMFKDLVPYKERLMAAVVDVPRPRRRSP